MSPIDRSHSLGAATALIGLRALSLAAVWLAVDSLYSAAHMPVQLNHVDGCTTSDPPLTVATTIAVGPAARGE